MISEGYLMKNLIFRMLIRGNGKIISIDKSYEFIIILTIEKCTVFKIHFLSSKLFAYADNDIIFCLFVYI